MNIKARRALLMVQRLAAKGIGFVMSPGLIALALAVCGVGALVAGVRLVFGEGWAYIVASVPLMFGALILARGALRA